MSRLAHILRKGEGGGKKRVKILVGTQVNTVDLFRKLSNLHQLRVVVCIRIRRQI